MNNIKKKMKKLKLKLMTTDILYDVNVSISKTGNICWFKIKARWTYNNHAFLRHYSTDYTVDELYDIVTKGVKESLGT